MESDHNHSRRKEPKEFSERRREAKHWKNIDKNDLKNDSNKQWMNKFSDKYVQRERRKFSKWDCKPEPENNFDHANFNARPLIPQCEEVQRDFLQNIIELLQTPSYYDEVEENYESPSENETTNQDEATVSSTKKTLPSLDFWADDSKVTNASIVRSGNSYSNGDSNSKVIFGEKNANQFNDESENVVKRSGYGRIIGENTLKAPSADNNVETEDAPVSSINEVSESYISDIKIEETKLTESVPNLYYEKDGDKCNSASTELSNPAAPSISLVPLSFLIDPKLQPSTNNENGTENTIANTEEADVTQSLKQPGEPNFKKPEVISKKLINKVATMDKTNIRNVINNPIMKFDVALKMHAKKRLREEIRKQLRSINFETRQTTEQNMVQPDGYIDPENIPVEMLREFETVFDIDFGNSQETSDGQTTIIDSSEENLSDSCSQPSNIILEAEATKNCESNLRTKLLNFEFMKQQAILRKCQLQSSDEDEICIIDSPRETVILSHDDSSVDSSTTSTTTTSVSSATPQQKMQEKFLESFKKDVLPKLPQNVRQEYENSSGKDEAIAKIYSMCLERLQNIDEDNGSSRLKFNGSNNDEALNFLVGNIRDLFTSGGRENGNINRANRVDEDTNDRRVKVDKNPRKRCYDENNSYTTHKETPKSSKEPLHRKEEDCNIKKFKGQFQPQQASGSRKSRCKEEHRDKKHYRQPNRKNFNDKYHYHRSFPAKRKRLPSENVISNGKGGLNQLKNDSTPMNKTKPVESSQENKLNTLPNNKNRPQSNSKDSYAIREKPHLPPEPPKSPQNNHADKPPNNPQSTCIERLWRSPGEKKCLEPTDTPNLPEVIELSPIRNLPADSVTPDSTGKIIESNDGPPVEQNNETHTEVPSSTEKSSTSSTSTLDCLKDLDTKLMQLNHKKMDIEKKIIELQKEKMEIDLIVMQLQNDRFALISSAVSSSNDYLTSNTNLQTLLSRSNMFNCSSIGVMQPTPPAPKAESTNKEKVSPVKTPRNSDFAEKLKNRKKRCQRDILIEDAASTLFPDSSNKHYEEICNSPPSEISAKVNDIFSMPARRNQRPVQVVTPEKSKGENLSAIKSSNASKSPPPARKRVSKASTNHRGSDNDMLPVSCNGQSVNIVESDDDEDSNESNQISCPISDGNITNGKLKGFRLPIVKIIGVEGYILCASEDGNIYKFDSSTREIISTFSKHTESITEMFVDGEGCIYSTSLDGYMKKTSVENFGLELQSVNLHEPLQTINLCWNIAFIGSRWGNILTYDVKKNKLNELLCSVGSAITAIKAAKEGPRQIIIIASKGEKIHLRDASSGLLLRAISVLENHNISNIVLSGGLLYCGSNANKVFVYDFTTGNEINSFFCGNGPVSIKIFRNKLLFIGCYDGFVYVLDKQSGQRVGRFPGSGKMILALEIVGDKVLTSSKDNAMQIVDIPKYILTLTK
ncbi:unnamed protein product [Hermetia illucens]|uniref:Uncharacterized protein n=1 Tax=Hermetia illucens TaxID=343691 RepID=A0A7R8Z1H9_HERIL|nr:IgA FC receptor [Hermetia illucens]CAD7092586.1 unnamed protein product [Hermetia illucens]